MISLEDWRQSEKVFTYHHHRLVYHDDGEGDVLLCIHGFPTASWDWTPMWSQLTQKFRVIAPDMIGFGFSAKPRNYDYSLFDQATMHEVLLGHRGINDIHILAHDYGDTVVQEMLARELEGVYTQGKLNIKSVCLLNGGIFPEAIQPIRLQTLMRGPLGPIIGRLMNRRKFGQSFASIFGPQTQPTTDELDTFWSLIMHNQGRLVMHKIIQYMNDRVKHRERWVGALQNTSIPMRLIIGPEDPISGENIADRYRELVSNPDVVLLPNIGHYPQLEAPEQVWQAYLEFFKKL